MNWNEIDPDNLPEGEVLAANFKPDTDGYKEKLIGYLYTQMDKELGVMCESDHTILWNCTHYINMNHFDITN